MKFPLPKLIDKLTIHASYVRVFESPDGHRVLAHILKTGGALKSSFVQGDSHKMAFNEGMRTMALSIAKFAGRDHNQMLELVEKGLQDDYQDTNNSKSR